MTYNCIKCKKPITNVWTHIFNNCVIEKINRPYLEELKRIQIEELKRRRLKNKSLRQNNG